MNKTQNKIPQEQQNLLGTLINKKYPNQQKKYSVNTENDPNTKTRINTTIKEVS